MQTPKAPRREVLHVQGHGVTPRLPEIAGLLWVLCPPNPIEPMRGAPGQAVLTPTTPYPAASPATHSTLSGPPGSGQLSCSGPSCSLLRTFIISLRFD